MNISIKPKIELHDLFQRGTDIETTGRFKETLQYNNFHIKDQNNLREIYKKLNVTTPQMCEIFNYYFNELNTTDKNKISIDKIEKYIKQFFLMDRSNEYVINTINYFKFLRGKQFEPGKLIVVFNQFSTFITTHLLHNFGLKPAKAFEYMKSVNSAINIDQQLLIETFTEQILENVISEISTMMDANAKIMYMKDLVVGLDHQTNDIKTATIATEELAASISDMAKTSEHISEKTTESVQYAENSKKSIEHALMDIFKTSDTFTSIVESFDILKNHVVDIENVVTIIKDIADQTNLLALNASIEAARAGEHGKGFSIVAQEVRKLSENTVAALTQVSSNVASLKSYSVNVSQSITETSKIINNASTEAKDTLPLLSSIVNSIESINQDVSNVAEITGQQANAIDLISEQMENILGSQENIRQYSSNTSRDIHALGQELNRFRNDVVNNNKLHLSNIALLNLSKADHILWKWKVYNMFLGLENLNPEDVSSHKDCRLGKWYYSAETKQLFSNNASYKKLEQYHELVHINAKEAVYAFTNGEISKADDALKKIDAASNKVLSYLNDLIYHIQQSNEFF